MRPTLVRRAPALLLAMLAAAGCPAQIAPLHDLDTLDRTDVTIEASGNRHQFEAWIAETPAQQAQGLMFVRDLPANRGMLFVYPEAREVGIWMKNTYIELDILFIAPDGRIVKIAERARPHSLETIRPEAPVTAVLEIRGGEAARRGIRVGDRATWRISDD